MSQQALKDELRALIAEIIECDESAVGDDKPLREIGVDSMQAIEIITDVEKRYKVKVEESEYKLFTTLASVATLLESKLAARG